MKPVTTKQLTLSFEPGLTQRFQTLRECVQWTVLNARHGMKQVASDIDMSMSDLSRRLNPSPGDPRSLDVNHLVEIIDATQDLTPIYWLLERFTQDDAAREDRLLSQFEALLPEISRMVATWKARKK